MSGFSNLGGVYPGSVTFQRRGSIGGTRHVFVGLQGNKNELVFPTIGGIVVNPYKNTGKMFAGDLVEFIPNTSGVTAKCLLLKTFTVDSVGSGVINIKRDGFKHTPEVGVMYMKAPAAKDTTGTAGSFSSVVEGDGVWVCTLNGSETLGTIAANDILVESAATAAGTGASVLVKNPNSVCPSDYDFMFAPATGDADFDGARYSLTPSLHGLMIQSRMSAIPPYALALNKSLISGWFEL